MRYVVNKESGFDKKQIEDLIRCFSISGSSLHQGRNEIRIVKVGEQNLNIKSFRVPNAVNKLAYRFFRKSKAERSFQYAGILIENGIGTPEPVAYAEERNNFSLGRSYYISRHLNYDLTYRELVTQPELEDHEAMLRAFTRFTFELHEKNILFLDHSPGNTLIKRDSAENYEFFLVDLNRMKFNKLDFSQRMKNFSRLTPKKEMVEVMADEYSKLIGKSKTEVFEKMWFFTNQFQKKFHRKKRLKSIFKSKKGKK